MGSAISIGTTGLAASSMQLDVIGNNLANANTAGYKAGVTSFASMLNQILPGSASLTAGQGVTVSSIGTQFSQGSLENTGNATDLAIDGSGFFVVKDKGGAEFYTRAGNFHVDYEGYLVDGKNWRVQGYDLQEQQGDISLKNAQSPPKATCEIGFGLNLDGSAVCGDQFRASKKVYDSKGAEHSLTIAFEKTEVAGMWGFEASLDGAKAVAAPQEACGLVFDDQGVLSGLYRGDIANATAVTAQGGTIDPANTVVCRPGQLCREATGVQLAKGAGDGGWNVVLNGGYTNAIAWQEQVGGVETLKLDLDGKGGEDIIFVLDNTWKEGDTITFDLSVATMGVRDLELLFGELANGATIGKPEGSGGAARNGITWDLEGESARPVTGYASPSVVQSLADDGYPAGTLKSFTVGSDGSISGFFSNGQNARLGQLMLADFPDASGLRKVGSYFAESLASGAAIKNRPGSGSLGEIESYNLEMSNTDVAKEFINMIIAQRAYQASSRVITTADQMLSELMNIKR